MQLVFTDQYATFFLLANGLAILLYIAARKKNRQRTMKLGNFDTLDRITDESLLRSNNILLLIRLLAFTSLMIAISSPVLVDQKMTTDSAYVMAIDSSPSMMTADLEPSRFEAAKDISSDFVSDLPNGTYSGAYTFSGELSRIHGLSRNREEVSEAISSAEVSGGAGTAMADAVQASASMLSGSDEKRQVILIGDGDANIGNLSDSIEYANRNNVTVNTIGIGTIRNTSEFRVVDGENGTYHGHPDLKEDNLRKVAEETNGTYVRAENRSAIEGAMLDVGRGETRQDIGRYFVFFAILLLLSEWIIGSTKYSILP